MKKLVITLALLLTAGTTVMAQDDSQASRQRWRNFETNKFTDNWEFSFGAGVQMEYGLPNTRNGIDINPQGFGKDFTLAVDAALGKWFTPIIGARIGATGWQITNYYHDATTWGVNEDGIENKWNYFDIHADFMVNLTNWVCHYKADRFYNLIGFVGIGWGQSWLDKQGSIEADDPSHNNEFIVPVGIINRFRLCDRWTFNIELRDQIVRNDFANRGELTGRQELESAKIDNLLSVTAGFTWKFSHKNDFNKYEPIDKAAYDNRISSLERDLQSAQDQNAEYQKQIDRYKQQLNDKERELQEALKNAAKETPTMVNDDVTLSIFFPIGSAEVSDKNEINIKYMADVIKASNKTFTITGYADNNTGSEQRNMELSQQRAEAVYNALVNAGVDKSRIQVDYKGCSVQPFEKDYLNRVAIIK